MTEPLDLSRRERQVMDILFERGPVTVAQIRGAMDDAPSDNAVRTFLTILAEKGHAKRKKRGRAYQWSAAPRRDRIGRDDLKRVVQTFFDGSPAKAFTAYLTDHETDLSDDELERLRQAIERSRHQGD